MRAAAVLLKRATNQNQRWICHCYSQVNFACKVVVVYSCQVQLSYPPDVAAKMMALPLASWGPSNGIIEIGKIY